MHVLLDNHILIDHSTHSSRIGRDRTSSSMANRHHIDDRFRRPIQETNGWPEKVIVDGRAHATFLNDTFLNDTFSFCFYSERSCQ